MYSFVFCVEFDYKCRENPWFFVILYINFFPQKKMKQIKISTSRPEPIKKGVWGLDEA